MNPGNHLHEARRAVRAALARCRTFVLQGAFRDWGSGSTIGRGARLIEPRLIRVGKGVVLGDHIWLNAKDDVGQGEATLAIGDGSYIGSFVQINAWRSVTIGNDVMIADRVFISDADHNYRDTRVPVKRQGDAFFGAVSLKDGCWIGIGAVILPGVTIGRNAVVSPNAVVMRDVPDCCVAGGIPARVIMLNE